MTTTDNPWKRTDGWLLLLLTLVAAASRIYCMDSFSLEEGEVSSYDKGLAGYFNPKFPGTELCVIASFKLFGPSEWSLRLPSVLFGIVSIPVFFLVARRLFNRFAAVSGALLIIFSAYLLDLAQLTRYYSATFLFGIVVFFFFYRYLETGAWKHLIAAILFTLCGMVFHPTFLGLPGAVVVYSVFLLILRPAWLAPVSFRAARMLVILASLGAVSLSPLIYPLVVEWFNRSQSLYGGWGYGPLQLSLQVVKYFSIPICATAMMGLICIFFRDRFRGGYFVCLMGLPLLGLLLASCFTDMRPDYVVFIYPLFFFAAGSFFSFVKENSTHGRVVASALVVSFLAILTPEFISNYTGRASLDIRKAVEFVKKHRGKNDKVISFLNEFNHYAGKDYVTEPYLGAVYQGGWKKRLRDYAKDTSRIWIILKQGRDAIDPDLNRWLCRYTRLVLEVSEKRYDYTFRSYRVYLKF